MADEFSRGRNKPHLSSGHEEANAESRQVPFISVIIPHYNDLENLRACLNLLASQTIPADQFEVIVADNNSICGLAAVQEVCGNDVKVVPVALQGAAEARNAGVEESRGFYLAFVDSDCRPAHDWLERGIASLALADMLGGRVDIDVMDEKNLTSVEAFERVFAFNFKSFVEKKGFSGAGNMFVSRSIFTRVGGFRTGVAEDKDWGQRAVKLGFHWKYAADVRVSHPARRDWDDLRRKWRRLVRESYLLTKEQRFGHLQWIARSWIVLFSPIFHVMKVLRSPNLNRFHDRLKAIGILFRIRFWRFLESYRILTDI